MSPSRGRPAVFFDRDGTLIRDTGYIRDPADVELLPDAGAAVRQVNDAGWPAIVVTNQSGIARGQLTEPDYERVRARVDALLAVGGAHLDAHYFCPHHPEVGGPCPCRKPGTLLFERAAADHGIDFTRSAFIGDRWRDVAPALLLGGRGILVPGSATPAEELARANDQAEVSRTLVEAVKRALSGSGPAMPAARVRMGVLASGGGSNLQAILDHLDALGDAAPAEVVVVASDRPAAGALDRARRRGISTALIEHPADAAALTRLLEAHAVELIALAGYLKLVPSAVVRQWSGAVVNVHPALLPRFGGAGMYGRRVHEAVLAAGERESGATVHLVDDAYDRGAILAQSRVPVERGDTADSLAARVLAAEHDLYPRTLVQLARSHATLHPRPA